MDNETAKLVEAARGGDTEAFGRLVKKHMKKAYYISLGMTGNHDDAMDVSQNAFVKAFRGIRHLRSGDSFVPWFYSILRRETVSFYRKERRHRRHLPETNPVVLQIPDDSAENRENLREMTGIVWKAMQDLPAEQKEIVLLRHFQDLDYGEIAEILGISAGSVSSRLFYARKALQQKIKEYMD